MYIGQLAHRTGVPARTIRYYEAMAILPLPSRTPAGYRIYDDRTAARLAFVQKAKRLGLGLREIREILLVYDRGDSPCSRVLHVLDRKIVQLDQQIAGLTALRDELADLKETAAQEDSWEGTPVCICGIIEGHAPTHASASAAVT